MIFIDTKPIIIEAKPLQKHNTDKDALVSCIVHALTHGDAA